MYVFASGFELEEYRRKEREKNVAIGLKENDAGQSSESEEEELRKPGQVQCGRVRHDIVVRSDDKNSSVPNFFKSSKKNPTTFPYFEEKLKFDEYGEIIRPEDYVIADSEDLEMAEGKTKVDWDEEMPVSLSCSPFSVYCFFRFAVIPSFQLKHIGSTGSTDQMYIDTDNSRDKCQCPVY